MYILYYDSKCPICTAFVRSLKKRIPPDRITFEPDIHSDQFKIKTSKGNVYYGSQAIDILLKEFPIAENYFYMLPNNYRDGAVKATVAVGSVIRKAINTVKRKCNCGKGR